MFSKVTKLTLFPTTFLGNLEISITAKQIIDIVVNRQVIDIVVKRQVIDIVVNWQVIDISI